MGTDRGTVTTFACSLVALIAVALLWVVPQHRMAQAACEQTVLIQERLGHRTDEVASLKQLMDELEEVRSKYESLKELPESSETPNLMAALTLTVDGERVFDQTFTAGSPSPVPQVLDGSLSALPLTIGMTGSFEKIYSLIERAENLPRLIRVGSVRMERFAERENAVEATIELRAIYLTGAERGEPLR